MHSGRIAATPRGAAWIFRTLAQFESRRNQWLAAQHLHARHNGSLRKDARPAVVRRPPPQARADVARVAPRHVDDLVPPKREDARELLAPTFFVEPRLVDLSLAGVDVEPALLVGRPRLGPDVVRRVPDVARLEARRPQDHHEGVRKLAAAARPRTKKERPRVIIARKPLRVAARRARVPGRIHRDASRRRRGYDVDIPRETEDFGAAARTARRGSASPLSQRA